MAELKMLLTPLSGSNYSTWKVQCKMALMKESLWKTVEGTETTPREEAAGYAKFVERCDRALMLLCYSWANKLSMRRKLHSLRLKEGDSVQDHIKQLIEIFNALSIMNAPL